MTTIFVGNLAWQTTESELRNTFDRYGRVTGVRVMTDRNTGTPRGFAFVNMPRMEDAEEAIVRLNGSSLSGRAITVNEAQSRDDAHGSHGGPPVPARRSALLDAVLELA